MNSMRIVDVLQSRACPGERLRVSGWVRTRRESKGFSFIALNDGSCMANLQIIAESSLSNYENEVSGLSTGSSVTVEGELTESPGEGQAVELHAESLTVHQTAPPDYPLQKKRHSFEFLRDIAHLRPRTNTLGAVMRIRSSLSYAIHTFFRERGYVYIHTPIITASDCEGAGEMFTVSSLDFSNLPRTEGGEVDFSRDFFGKQARLTVSGQLEGEACALALGNIYTFGPTFRAENSNTSRHLAEFWMVEPETAFCDLWGDMDLAEEFVRYCVQFVLNNDRDDINFFNQRIEKNLVQTLENIADNTCERLSYTDALAVLEKNNGSFEFPVSWGSDIQSEHERFLTEQEFRKPVILYDYPAEIKAFYMKRNDDNKTVRAMDLLVPRIGELIGGSEREDRIDVLIGHIKKLNLAVEDYQWYLDLRRFGGAPHAGFGLGFERLIQLVTGMQNIRDVIPFPRYPGNAEF